MAEKILSVAILMTLEGEYYAFSSLLLVSSLKRRNPHDIGRRILLWQRLTLMELRLSRNPHDIGRRILPKVWCAEPRTGISRNPHDIGRRILLRKT